MAKEYQRTSGGTLQWKDPSAGVQGWNNIERSEESQYPGAPQANPAPQAAPPPPPAAAPAMAGLAAAAPPTANPAAPPPPPMPTFTPISGGAAASGPPLAAASSSGSGGTVIQGQMEPGPGFVESGQGAGALRGLGQRRPPEQSMALAGLGRAY